MTTIDVTVHKTPAKTTTTKAEKLLVSQNEATDMLSISCPAVDYLVANKQIMGRRIGARVLIPISDLTVLGSDNPERIAG